MMARRPGELTGYQRSALRKIAAEWQRDGVERAAAREHCLAILEADQHEEAGRLFDSVWPAS